MLIKSYLERVDWSKYCDYLTWCLVFLGILVRLVQYLSNRSLWGDEVNLALNIIDRSYLELTQTLDYNQAAPLGFLWLEKLATQVFGNSEYALRLLPFVASIVSLGVFYCLTRLYSSPGGGVIAIALFVGGRYLLYFATELKPYSSDVAIALILFWLLSRVHHQMLKVKEIIGLAILGSLAIWFSYPSVFMLAGLEAWNLLTASSKRWYKIIVNRIGIYITWIVSFGLFYFVTIADTLTNEDLSSSWSARYPDSFGDILWLFDALGRFFYHPMGFAGIADGIGIFAFIVGCVAWYRRDHRIFLALIAPFIMTLFAAYLRQYPFRDRLVLFLAPLGILIVAEGIALLLTQLGKINLANRYRCWLFGLLGIVCLYALTVPTISRASNLIIHPEVKHEVRPVVEYVAAKYQPGDKIYVYAGAVQAFAYYVDLKDYSNLNYANGSANFSQKGSIEETRSQFATEIEPLSDRVWFVFRAEADEELAAREYLDTVGQQLDSFQQPGASAYLYRL